ncbi:MAG: DUF1080 domain-containing protein, partial [Planctomycetota bacterium]
AADPFAGGTPRFSSPSHRHPMMPASLLAAALVAPSLLLAAPAEPADSSGDVTVLFDGSSTDAWEKYNGGEIGSNWVVEDGELHFKGKNGGGSGGDIQTKETFGDFDLRFEFKVAPGSNSGVIYGVVPIKGQPPYKTGPEFQILDDAKHPNGRNPKTSVGSMYALYSAKPIKPCPANPDSVCPHSEKTVMPVGEWNEGRIVKTGSRIRHYLNGEKVVDVQFDSPEVQDAISKSKFKSWDEFAQPIINGQKSRIVFQDHSDPVWYRNVTVRTPTLTEDGPLLEE